ncbi:LegC family aminotransferase [Denitratisoma sp. agr-D3]
MSTSLPDLVVAAVRNVTGNGPVALHEPSFQGNEWTYLKECLDTGYVSSVGAFVNRFEADLAAYTGARHAVAVVNGTAALQVALHLAGVLPGEEVLVPALTFVATASAVMHGGAVPHFVDSETGTLGIDPVRLREYLAQATEMRGGLCCNRRSGRVIRALVPMHTFGHPVDIDGLIAVAHDFQLEVVEDAAESLGSTVNGRHTGTFGKLGTLSFNGNKTITTGGGGAILTNDPEMARRAKHLTTTAKVPHRWEYVHDEIGFNYRMPNINAALGCAQLEQMPRMLQSKRALYHRYVQAFSDVPGVGIVGEPQACTSNFWLQTLLLDTDVADQRDAILQATNDAGQMTRPAWRLLHRLQPYQNCPRMNLAVAESLEQRLINLPSSAGLGGA